MSRRSAADAAQQRGALFRPVIATVPAPASTTPSTLPSPHQPPPHPIANSTDITFSYTDTSSLESRPPCPELSPLDTYKEMSKQLPEPLPPIALSFALAAEAAGVPYIGQRPTDTSSTDSTADRTRADEGAHTQTEHTSEDAPPGCGRRAENGGGATPKEAAGVSTTHMLPLPRQLEQPFDAAFPEAARTRHVWGRCSMVVGMHPDEATEPIVDTCLR